MATQNNLIGQLSNYVNLLPVKTGIYCLSHAVNQELIFGDKRLRRAHHILVSNLSPEQKGIKIRALFGSNDADNLINTLRQNHYFKKDISESIFNYLPQKSIPNPSKKYKLLRVLLCDVCNLQCSYCKVMKNVKNLRNASVENRDLKKVLKTFFQGSISTDPKVIHITGGEPLIFWKKVMFIVTTAKSLSRTGEKLMIVIGTNGLLLDEEKTKFIKKNNVKVIVSLDGTKAVNDTLRKAPGNISSFEAANKAILLLNKFRVDVGISMVIGKHNLSGLKSHIEFIRNHYYPKSLGVNFMKPPTPKETNFPYMISPQEYVKNIYSAFKEFRSDGLFFELVYRRLSPFVFKQFRFYDCGAAEGSTINIDTQGNIGPCKSFLIMEMLAQRQKEKSINEVLDQLRKRSPVYFKKCKNCPAMAICGNGCAYEAWISSSNIDSIDQHACGYTRLFFSEMIKDLFDYVQRKIYPRGYYLVSNTDRLALLGKVTVNKNNLNSSIGHET